MVASPDSPVPVDVVSGMLLGSLEQDQADMDSACWHLEKTQHSALGTYLGRRGSLGTPNHHLPSPRAKCRTQLAARKTPPGVQFMAGSHRLVNQKPKPSAPSTVDGAQQ
jgi:hypothetical protein